MKPCTVNECPRPLLARGMCATHYGRWRSGKPVGTAELRRSPGDPTATEKKCTGCNAVKPLDQFFTERRNVTGRTSRCKVCVSRKSADARMLRLYGITRKERDAIAERQGHKCAICQETRPLVADHCHRSGRFRALLCDRCNRLLGVADDQAMLLRAALQFLEEHS